VAGSRFLRQHAAVHRSGSGPLQRCRPAARQDRLPNRYRHSVAIVPQAALLGNRRAPVIWHRGHRPVSSAARGRCVPISALRRGGAGRDAATVKRTAAARRRRACRYLPCHGEFSLGLYGQIWPAREDREGGPHFGRDRFRGAAAGGCCRQRARRRK
jgi:hypothetical protein